MENGIRERWVRVKTSGAATGWVLTFKFSLGTHWDSGNFDNLCAD
jgi:hypothetical protein